MAGDGDGNGEVLVVTASGSGHLFPCIELCKHIASRNYTTTLVLPSTASTSVPSSFLQHHHPLLNLAEISPSPFFPGPGFDPSSHQSGQDLEAHLCKSPTKPICAIIDFQMGWTKLVFSKFNVPVVSFFTFGACAAAMEHAAWKAQVSEMNAGEVRRLPGLPEEMSLSYSDIQRRPRPSGSGPPGGRVPGGGGGRGPNGGGGRGPGGGGGPKVGNMPPWVPAIEGSLGLMFNTCEELEHPFIEYMSEQMGLPIWGVGPLLPQGYWSSPNSLIRDRDIRQQNQQSDHTTIGEEEVMQWLDSKPRGSVLYISFGSMQGPTMEDQEQLARALEMSTTPFIWVMKSEVKADMEKIRDRGLLIKGGWAPQLLILSHPSTGGFLSHCGWNSTVEAIGRGVPMLAWPNMGDQHMNAKLVVEYLRVGIIACKRGPGEMVRKEELVEGIERLMTDEEVKRKAKELREKFEDGFPKSSETAFDHFRDFINQLIISNA